MDVVSSRTQNSSKATSWGFNSPSRHHLSFFCKSFYSNDRYVHLIALQRGTRVRFRVQKWVQCVFYLH
jgi:hypothetical protein